MSKNDPAYPIVGNPVYAGGLTKLEWFAGMALQGMMIQDRWRNDDKYYPENTARHACDIAEALLAELEKRQK